MLFAMLIFYVFANVAVAFEHLRFPLKILVPAFDLR